jgi:hypothetical protein
MATRTVPLIKTKTRTIDGLSIRYAESAPREVSAILLSPWPESLYTFEQTWSRLAEHAHLNLSTSQAVAALAPGARLVKALNNSRAPYLEADPLVNGARRVAFISADDDGAKKRVEILLDGFGYSVIDLGNLRDGGLIQQAGGPLAGRDLLEQGERHK